MADCEGLIQTDFQNMPPKDFHILVGGPVSTLTVRDVWQYENGRSSGLSLKRVDEPLLPLRYSFLIDEDDDRMKLMGRVAWTFADGSVKIADLPNRPLTHSWQRDRMLVPQTINKFRMIRGN